MRVTAPLTDEDLLHRCWLAYMSDDMPAHTVRQAHPDFAGSRGTDITFVASLDHTIWYHRPLRADEWHLYDVTCHAFNRARGLAFGHIFAIDGTNGSGAAAALEAKGLDGTIGLVGYDAYPDNVAKIKSGIFTALIAQDPAAEARLAIKSIVEFIRDGKTSTKAEVVIPNVVLDETTSADDLSKYTYVAN